MRSGAQEEVSTESLTQGMPLTPSLPHDRTEGQTAQDLAGPRSKESVAQRRLFAEMASVMSKKRGGKMCVCSCVWLLVCMSCVLAGAPVQVSVSPGCRAKQWRKTCVYGFGRGTP